MIPRIGLVGIGGYGASHLGAVLAAHRDGRVRLVGVADPRPPVEGLLPDGVAHHPDATGLFAAAIALACASLGIFGERWLFFAQARHLVTLYY